MQIIGSFSLSKISKSGEVLETMCVKNLITTEGIKQFANILANGLGDTITSLSLGTGTATPRATDTDLETPVVNGILVGLAGVLENKKPYFEAVFTDNIVPNDTYTEIGAFGTSGMYARALLSPSFVKTAGVDILVRYDLTLGA